MESSTGLSDGFAERLRAAREQLGSREAAAILLGISDVTLWRWESGQSSPTVEQLHHMQNLGFDVIQLLTGSSLTNFAPMDDDQRWGRCAQVVFGALDHHKLKPSPATCWRLVRLLYSEAINEAQLKKNVALALEKAGELASRER
ncbi:helix-turn-helix transcriptional regulator [Polaromonas sp.]|uniref:helix-turn-helix domain-containing protein n=1 Tax=Polaromonas sp. TaxID=1869339 RepID=UPI00326726F9